MRVAPNARSIPAEVEVSRVAAAGGISGLAAVACYAVITAADLGSAAPFVASLFGPLLVGASFMLYLVLATDRPTLSGQLAAIANAAAGALVTAMLLVQLALDEAKTGAVPVDDALKHVEFGLDLSWDVFIAAGTILFGFAMMAHPRFGRVFGVTGILIGLGLYALNFATFPTPPGDDGLVDLGPLVGLWYAVVSVRLLRLRRAPL